MAKGSECRFIGGTGSDAFNEKAWANEQMCIQHLWFFENILSARCPEFVEHMLLLDGLGAQATTNYIELALDMNILQVYFPPNCIHLVQPVVHRVAAHLNKTYYTYSS